MKITDTLKNKFVQPIKEKPVSVALSTLLVANAAMIIAGTILSKQGKISPEIFTCMVVSAVAFLSLALAFTMMKKGEKGEPGKDAKITPASVAFVIKDAKVVGDKVEVLA